MQDYIHSLNSFGTGKVCGKSRALTIVCRDAASITRVYHSDADSKRSVLGRGWTLSIPDRHGKMVFSDGRLTSFTDSSGNCYRFFYYADSLECISTPQGMIFYDYNADGVLTNVVYPDGRRAYISYNDLLRIQDICLKNEKGEGVFAISYFESADSGVEYLYEYGYQDHERVEKRFCDFSNSEILTLSGVGDILKKT